MKTVSAVQLDAIDRKMLRVLQQDGRITNADLARQVALSESACLRRLRALESAGVIGRYAAMINERAVGLPISVFVTVTLASQSEAALTAFEAAVAAVPEVMECYLMTGGSDYLLRLVVPNVDIYDAVYKQLISRLDFTDITSFISMEELKFTTAVPLRYA